MRHDDLEDGFPTECPRCHGSGEVGVQYIGHVMKVVPGPVPDDAANYSVQTCYRCRGMGYVEE